MSFEHPIYSSKEASHAEELTNWTRVIRRKKKLPIFEDIENDDFMVPQWPCAITIKFRVPSELPSTPGKNGRQPIITFEINGRKGEYYLMAATCPKGLNLARVLKKHDVPHSDIYQSLLFEVSDLMTKPVELAKLIIKCQNVDVYPPICTAEELQAYVDANERRRPKLKRTRRVYDEEWVPPTESDDDESTEEFMPAPKVRRTLSFKLDASVLFDSIQKNVDLLMENQNNNTQALTHLSMIKDHLDQIKPHIK